MVEYLDGNRIQGSSTKPVPPAKTSWKELGRTTLTSTNDSIDVSSFTAKDNLMILCNVINSGGDFRTFWRFNSDTGSNYSQRYNTNNGSDSTNTSLNGTMDWNTAESVQSFEVLNIANITAQEKLGIKHKIGSGTAGAGNGVNYVECVGKWANTSAQITSVSVGDGVDPKSGTGGIGSEVVVLGCDNDEADSGTPYWERLADFTQTTASSSMDTGTFTAKKYLWIQVHEIANANLDMNYLRFNSDSGSNYSFRKANNGASSDTNTSITGVLYATHNGSVDHYAEFFIVNNSDKEKLITGTCTDANSNNQEPRRKEFASKWVNTSSQITSVQTVDTGSGSNPIGVGSRITVWGAN